MTVIAIPYFMLVDDDDAVELAMRTAMGQLSVQRPLLVAKHGEEALRLLRADSHPDCGEPANRFVMLDCDMPVMNGIDFLRELRSDPSLRETPVVMITSSESDEDRDAALALGVEEYLAKPTTIDGFASILSLVSSLLDDRETDRTGGRIRSV